MRPLNILDELVRPATLALRLFGNILASTVMGRCSLAAARFGVMGTDLSLDLFDLFIGLLQALIFTLLTIIYFGFAAGPDEDTQP